jgi:hypothetical protein
MVALAILGGLLCLVGVVWIVFTASMWMIDRGKLSGAPISDGIKPITAARQNEVYEQRVVSKHRIYLVLRRGFPWSVGALFIGIALAIIGSH